MKFKCNDIIFYMLNNKVHSAPILSTLTVKNSENHASGYNKEQLKFFRRFGEDRTQYATCHGIVNDVDAFISKEALVMELL